MVLWLVLLLVFDWVCFALLGSVLFTLHFGRNNEIVVDIRSYYKMLQPPINYFMEQ